MDQNKEFISALREGKVVIFPTDTAIGIGCRIDDESAVKRVFRIKKRDLSEALLVLVSDIEMAEDYVDIPKEVRKKLIDTFWPGGLTIFFRIKEGKVLPCVTAGTNVLAVRLPNHNDLIKLIKSVGVPIVATSANVSGEETPYRIEDVNPQILEQVDFVLKGECTYKKESTLIDTTVSPWKVVRNGAVNLHEQDKN